MNLWPKRISVCLIAILSLASLAHAQPLLRFEAGNGKLWERYKQEFVQQDGRIMDKKQNYISHSEGQGYGMLLSVMHNDKAAFKTIWQWTKSNLQGRKDNLFAWSWGARQDGLWGIIDYNNSTDGDVMIAYALVKAAQKWNESVWRAEGVKIVDSLRKYLSIRWGSQTFLLPAYYGFYKADEIILNPSYLIFPAYRAFSEIDDKTFWNTIYRDSILLMGKSMLGRLKLPPDWITLNKTGISMNVEKGASFGYDSIRTILYLSWEDNPAYRDGINEIFKVYQRSGVIPRSFDLAKDTRSPDEAPAGFYALYARAAEKMGNRALSLQLFKVAEKKLAAEKDDYYSMSLYLLAIQNPL